MEKIKLNSTQKSEIREILSDVLEVEKEIMSLEKEISKMKGNVATMLATTNDVVNTTELPEKVTDGTRGYEVERLRIKRFSCVLPRRKYDDYIEGNITEDEILSRQVDILEDSIVMDIKNIDTFTIPQHRMNELEPTDEPVVELEKVHYRTVTKFVKLAGVTIPSGYHYNQKIVLATMTGTSKWQTPGVLLSVPNIEGVSFPEHTEKTAKRISEMFDKAQIYHKVKPLASGKIKIRTLPSPVIDRSKIK